MEATKEGSPRAFFRRTRKASRSGKSANYGGLTQRSWAVEKRILFCFEKTSFQPVESEGPLYFSELFRAERRIFT